MHIAKRCAAWRGSMHGGTPASRMPPLAEVRPRSVHDHVIVVARQRVGVNPAPAALSQFRQRIELLSAVASIGTFLPTLPSPPEDLAPANRNRHSQQSRHARISPHPRPQPQPNTLRLALVPSLQRAAGLALRVRFNIARGRAVRISSRPHTGGEHGRGKCGPRLSSATSCSSRAWRRSAHDPEHCNAVGHA